MRLLIDNYDSFSYNLYQLIGTIVPDIKVIRNDEYSVEEIISLHPRSIILSPGPGRPINAGVCETLVKKVNGTIPILGICLGHQAICESYGGTITYAKALMHGKNSEVNLDLECPIFYNLTKKMKVGRYHSLIATNLPDELIVTALAEDGQIMAVRHETKPVFGLQFHPESILTPQGKTMLENFIYLS